MTTKSLLREHQCDRMQGYLVSSAIKPDLLEALVRRRIQKTA